MKNIHDSLSLFYRERWWHRWLKQLRWVRCGSGLFRRGHWRVRVWQSTTTAFTVIVIVEHKEPCLQDIFYCVSPAQDHPDDVVKVLEALTDETLMPTIVGIRRSDELIRMWIRLGGGS